MAMTPSEITALMSSGQSLSSVANQLQNAGVSLEDVSKASGASVADLTNILNQGGVSFGNYTSPAPPSTPAVTTISSGATDAQIKGMLSSGLPMAEVARKLGYAGIGLDQIAKAAGVSPEAIKAEAAKGGINFNGNTIMLGGTGVGQTYDSIAAEMGGRMVKSPDGKTITYEGPGGTDRVMDISRILMGNTPGQNPLGGYGAGLLNNTSTQQQSSNYAYGNTQRAPSYTAPINQSQTKPLAVQGIAPIGQGGYSFGNRSQMRPSPYGMGGYGGMYPYQNYGRQGMFGGTASSRMPYTGYQAYQPYGGYGRNTGMFGAPTMNYNMRNRPMQQITPYQQMGWSQNNPWSFQ